MGFWSLEVQCLGVRGDSSMQNIKQALPGCRKWDLFRDWLTEEPLGPSDTVQAPRGRLHVLSPSFHLIASWRLGWWRVEGEPSAMWALLASPHSWPSELFSVCSPRIQPWRWSLSPSCWCAQHRNDSPGLVTLSAFSSLYPFPRVNQNHSRMTTVFPTTLFQEHDCLLTRDLVTLGWW